MKHERCACPRTACGAPQPRAHAPHGQAHPQPQRNAPNAQDPGRHAAPQAQQAVVLGRAQQERRGGLVEYRCPHGRHHDLRIGGFGDAQRRVRRWRRRGRRG